MKRLLVRLARSAAIGLAVITATGVFGSFGCGDGRANGVVGGSAPVDRESDSEAVLAITTPPDASSTMLSWVDRETLAPQRPGFDLGEYHGGWAFSPDREQLAVGTFARTGLRIVDPGTLMSNRDVPLPVAAVAVGWISRDRVAVLLQRGGVLLIDANRGTVVRRWRMSYRFPCERRRQAVTRHGVIFVVGTRDGGIRMIRVSGSGALHVISLPQVRTPPSAQICASAALAIDPSGNRAVVVGSRGPLVEVSLKSLVVRSHGGPSLRRALGKVEGCRRDHVCAGRRVAVWSDSGTLLVGGVNSSGGRNNRTETPLGVSAIDPATWSARRLDGSATDMAVVSGGTLLTFGGRRRGVRASSINGSHKWSALDAERIRAATVTGTRVYALSEAMGTYVIDASTGRVISAPPTSYGRLDVLSDRADSGTHQPRRRLDRH